jgi:hypothetical protein
VRSLFKLLGRKMSPPVDEEESLATLLTDHMSAADFGTTTLTKAVTAKFGSSLILRSTLTNWRDGLVKKPKSSSWEALIAVLHILGLDRREANRVLHAAGLRSLEELLDIHSNHQQARRLFEPWLASIENQSRGTLQDHENALFSALRPLSSEQRTLIRESRAVLTAGINLYRLFSAFQLEFRHMLNRGGVLHTLLSHPDGVAMQMAALRSESRTPEDTQRQHARQTLELLASWKANKPKTEVQVRLLDYLPPYGITIMHPLEKMSPARCLARIFPFRSSTSEAPAIDLDSEKNPEWFRFFYQQFEKMWEAGEPYSLED